MGRGNVCVNGKYEGLFYVDNDLIDMYVGEEDGCSVAMTRYDMYCEGVSDDGFEYDEVLSRESYDDFIEKFVDDFCKKFNRYNPCKKWIGYNHDLCAIAESSLFYIAVTDNEWSTAVMLIQKDDPYYDIRGLQKRHFQKYLDGIRDCLFEQFDELGTYTGAWTSGRIRRSDFLSEKKGA